MFAIVNPAIDPILGEYPYMDNPAPFASIILGKILSNFISLALGSAGVITFFLLLWGGIQYILAGGDKERTQAASKRITHALIGLAITFSVFAIIYVVETLFGVSLREFTIPTIP